MQEAIIFKMIKTFNRKDINKLFIPKEDSSGEDNGQVTIIGGSKLFHGAPLLSLKVASRLSDMVFFASPEKKVGEVANLIKSSILSFIWVPWDDIESYIQKSDAVLIGPGFMRFGSEKTPEEERNSETHIEGKVTREITKRLLEKFPEKKWVIDAGSLQVMDAKWIPPKAILTPNKKEFEMLFGFCEKEQKSVIEDKNFDFVRKVSEKHDCTIVLKGPETVICSGGECALVKGGNAGLTKGGTGDILAGLTVSLYAKNDAFLSAACASFIEKYAAEEIYKEKGTFFNADDLSDKIPESFFKLLR